MTKNKDFSMRNPLAHARGLGSAKEGSHHWWLQRVTAVVLVPAVFWLVASIIFMIGQPYEIVRVWFGNLFVATLLILVLFATFYHSVLGIQVIIEDYVHQEGARIATLWICKAALIVAGAVSILAVLRMGLGF